MSQILFKLGALTDSVSNYPSVNKVKNFRRKEKHKLSVVIEASGYMYIPLAQIPGIFCVNVYKPAVVVPTFIPLCHNIHPHSPPPHFWCNIGWGHSYFFPLDNSTLCISLDLYFCLFSLQVLICHLVHPLIRHCLPS